MSSLDEDTTLPDLRDRQTRHFDTLESERIMLAGLQVLQDLGFTIDETSKGTGLVVGTKKREAAESGQVATQIFLMFLAAALGSSHSPVWDESQDIYAIMVISPDDAESQTPQTEVRISFERRLTNNYGDLWRIEFIDDEKIYQEFYEKMDQALLIEGQTL